jgi:sugar phosphate isomerase/epimerase
LGIGERPTISVPRLGTKIGLFDVCDGTFDENGLMTGFKIPGTGDVELERAIELLRGVVYRDYLMFEWPTAGGRPLAPPDEVLPQAHSFLRSCVDRKQPVLTAYKGDKRPTKLASPPPQPSTRPV